MKLGTKVKYIRIDTEDDKKTGFYPSIGTLGTVVDADKTGIRVKWEKGTKDEGVWWCGYEDVEEVQNLIMFETKRDIYNELTKLLTDYENPTDVEDYDDYIWEAELYEMLVKIQNRWEDTITADED